MDVVLKDGAVVCVSDSFDDIFSWVALEQEDWFEDEISFLRATCKPGWNAIDVGASHGVYSLALALHGASHVWAIEPVSETFELLCHNVRLNALSERISALRWGVQSGSFARRRGIASGCEPGADGIHEGNEGISLDALLCTHLPRSCLIDFIRIDAEGSELQVLLGCSRFLNEQSPLIMFRLNHHGSFNIELIAALRAMGYGIYSLLPGLQCLRPVLSEDECSFDHFLQNLFACKSDRAAALAADGILIEHVLQVPIASLVLKSDSFSELLALPVFAYESRGVWDLFDFSSPYGQALLAWCSSRKRDAGPELRLAFLRQAQQCIAEALAVEDYHPAVTMLAVRVLSDLGERARALQAASAFLDQMAEEDMLIDRPVPPVLESFDFRRPKASLTCFLYESVVEFSILRSSCSGFVASANERLFNHALVSPEHSAEIERRAVLFSARDGASFNRRRLSWLFEPESNANRGFWRKLAVSQGFFRDIGDWPLSESLQRGDACIENGAVDEALDYFRYAAEIDSSSAEAHYKQGVVLRRLEQLTAAADAFRSVLQRQPDHRQAANNLGQVLVADHRYMDAEVVYRSYLSEHPVFFDIHISFANYLRETGRSIEALYYLRQALRLEPDSATVLNLLGVVLISLSRSREALPFLRRAVELKPTQAHLWNDLGRCNFIRGQLDEAVRCYSEALKNSPECMPAWMNRLMICNYRTIDRDDVFDLHKSFGAKANEVFARVDPSRFLMSRDKDRRLRVGFVSGDFRRHSVSYFIEGVLEQLDRTNFQLFAYFNSDPDERTAVFRRYFNYWRDIKNKDDQEVAEKIVDDRIDILFDLAGHTSGNRLLVFAAKPAPIQVTWIGYPNTSGLDTIDYRFTDKLVDPENEADRYFTERLWRLPNTFLCYSPPSCAPQVVSPPFERNGFVTFGSFNTQFKLGDETLSLWSKVLAANPNSRMLIKSAIGLSDSEGRDLLKDRLVAFGVPAERIDVQAALGGGEEHLALYGNVDIALDPYPYHGTTTTFEALWMGVPVVSLVGNRHASRVGVSIMTNAGLPELLAGEADQYVRIATELAHDRGRLASLRLTMRERLAATPLLDAKAMAEFVGSALRSMWAAYCDVPTVDSSIEAAPKVCNSMKPKLHVGGCEPRAGWKILNSRPGQDVDYVCDVRDLAKFASECFAEIYCSHVLEHLGMGDILPVLNEFYRLLPQGGKLSLSVPDLDTLAWLFTNPQFATAERFQIMRIIFGGQSDEYDFHHVGFNLAFMFDYLKDVGFSSVEHVESLGLFDDTSEMKVGDVRVSLNLIAVK